MKTWGEVSVPEAKVATSPDAARATSFLAKFKRPTLDHRDAVIPTCDYDEVKKRLVDFVLPDLEGKPVRFQDLDSDYVLLDFWGTWCKPCVKSIPHLTEIQKKYGPGKIRVVGIACEKSSPQVARVQVDEFTRTHGINYAVLLSDQSGKDPVQAALNVRYFPTMILLNRQGEVVWSAVGATPANLKQLEKVLSTAMATAATARR